MHIPSHWIDGSHIEEELMKLKYTNKNDNTRKIGASITIVILSTAKEGSLAKVRPTWHKETRVHSTKSHTSLGISSSSKTSLMRRRINKEELLLDSLTLEGKTTYSVSSNTSWLSQYLSKRVLSEELCWAESLFNMEIAACWNTSVFGLSIMQPTASGRSTTNKNWRKIHQKEFSFIVRHPVYVWLPTCIHVH